MLNLTSGAFCIAIDSYMERQILKEQGKLKSSSENASANQVQTSLCRRKTKEFGMQLRTLPIHLSAYIARVELLSAQLQGLQIFISPPRSMQFLVQHAYSLALCSMGTFALHNVPYILSLLCFKCFCNATRDFFHSMASIPNFAYSGSDE